MSPRKRKVVGDPKRAVAYIRVSTDDQTLGPEAQRTAIQAWAARERVEIVGFFEDLGVSGGAPVHERPGLLDAIQALELHKVGVLVAAKRDRLARSVLVAATLEALVEGKGGRIRTVDGASDGDSAEAALMRTIVDAVAQYERAQIKLRTKMALGVKKARGERVGAVPYGFKLAQDGVKLEPVAEEQATIARARELRAGGAPLRAIASTLAAEGHVSRNGKPFQPMQVSRLLA